MLKLCHLKNIPEIFGQIVIFFYIKENCESPPPQCEHAKCGGWSELRVKWFERIEIWSKHVIMSHALDM